MPAPKRPLWLQLASIVGVWTLAFIVIIGVLYMMFALVGERRAHADAPDVAATIFDKPGECQIDADLRVSGSQRAACVDRLETAARLARAEMRVNERTKTSKRR